MAEQTHADWLRDFVHEPIVTRIEEIADELEAKDRTIAALTAERDRLREAYDAGAQAWAVKREGKLTLSLSDEKARAEAAAEFLAEFYSCKCTVLPVRIVEASSSG